MPESIFIRVVLPLPFSPKRDRISPLRMSKETFLFAVIVPKCLVMSTMRTANSVSTCSFLSVLCFILRRCSRMLHDSQKRTPALACAVSYLCRTFYFNRLNRVCKAKAAFFWHGFQKNLFVSKSGRRLHMHWIACINEKRMPDKSPASRRIHGKRTITFPANIQLNRV